MLARAMMETARLLHIRSSALAAAVRLVWVCKRRSDRLSHLPLAQSLRLKVLLRYTVAMFGCLTNRRTSNPSPLISNAQMMRACLLAIATRVLW